MTKSAARRAIAGGCNARVFSQAAPTNSRIASTIIVGDRGNPVSAASLSRMVRLQLRDMGVSGYSIHGLRKNAGNAIAEAGGTEREIMVRLGHKNSADGRALHQACKPRIVYAVGRRKAGTG